ncbi:MAG TPA: YggS family pyridoxal phosphate-dependent enzyme [Acidobacteriaceae bacterium]|nr:YggS family pyridoxal phosphate-dependent enzyme [Acidobacteriaceae bacterium]
MSIPANLERIHNEIADACARAHRDPSTVALMAVSKMHPADAILEAHAAGQRLFGENRVQEWQSKLPTLSSASQFRTSAVANLGAPSAPFASELSSIQPIGLEVHLIGPLQNNKTNKAAEIFHAVDTIDSFKTAERLNRAAATLHKTLPVLIEVKLSPEETKHGLAPEELPTLLDQLAPLNNLHVRGLMTVPPWCTPEDAETARPYFQHLRRLRDQIQPTHPTLTELSMGMTNDFRIAIEEGSTTVRIGTAIFGKRTLPASI